MSKKSDSMILVYILPQITRKISFFGLRGEKIPKLKDTSDYEDEILEIFHTRFSDLPSKYLSDDGSALFTSTEALMVLEDTLNCIFKDK